MEFAKPLARHTQAGRTRTVSFYAKPILAPGRYQQLVLLLVLVLAANFATAGQRRYFFDTHDSQSALVQQSVNAIFQDNAGFVWIGTQAGLHKYDGYSMQLFEHSVDNAHSLPSSYVTAIAQDDFDQLWVGGRTGGLARLDPTTGNAETFALPTDAQHAQQRNSISAMQFDAGRGLWIASAAGIELLDVVTGARREIFSLGDNQHIDRLTLGADGTLWIAASSGLLRISPSSDAALPVAADRIKAAHAVIVTASGEVFCAATDGLYRVDTQQNKAEHLWPTAAAANVGKSSDANDLVQDAQGKFWMAILGEGLAVVDADLHATQWVQHDRHQPGTLPERFETTMLLDRSGLLWVGGNHRGFATTDPAGAPFRLITNPYAPPARAGMPDIEVGNLVLAVLEGPQHKLWIATEHMALERYDPQNDTFEDFAQTLAQALGRPAVDSRLHVTAIRPAPAGHLWIASNHGAFLLDPVTRTAKLLHLDQSAEGVRAASASRIVMSARDGSIWLATGGNGIAHSSPARDHWDYFRHRDGDDTTLAHDFVLSMLEDRDGSIWIGTLDGVSVYDPGTKGIRSFRHAAKDATSLSDSVVHALHRASDGTMWVGTHDGLNRLVHAADKRTAPQFERFSVRDGLVNATIYAILDDSDGNLWLSSNRGIQRFDVREKSFRAFSLNDGMQGMEFTSSAAARLANGDLAFGGTEGTNVFSPEAIRLTPFQPPIVITSAQIGNAESSVGIQDDARLQVNQADRVLHLAFAALDYASPASNKFAYRLVGFDDAWIQAGTRHDVTYTNLPAGDYTLQVRATNRDGVWGSNVATLPITIRPPWWNARELQLLYAAILLGAIALSGFLLMRRRELERARNQELERRDERFRMALWGSGEEFWDLDLRTQQMHRIGAIKDSSADADPVVDESWLAETIHPDDLPLLQQRRLDYLEGRSALFEAEYRTRTSDGEWTWRLSRGKFVEWDKDGAPIRASGTARDVTQTRLADRQRRVAMEVLNSMTEAVCVTDLEFRCVSVNHAFTRMSGYEEADILGRSIALLRSPRQSGGSYDALCSEYVRTGHWRGEAWQQRSNGEEFLGSLEVNAVYDERGVRTHYVNVMTDITDRKRTEQDLRYLANYDTLTDLPNRSLFIERLSAATDRARRDGSRLAVLFLDLDRFKHVNDSLGHIAGDQVLKAVGARLRSSVREADTVARIGGDEFTILIESLGTVDEAEAVARKIIGAFATPLDLAIEREMSITPSIGISIFPEHARGPMNLLKFADTAMYKAKDQGRNTYMLYTPAMDTAARLWADTASALRTALEHNELSVVYQPKLSLRDNTVTGVEALLRWHSDVLGEISPSHFIPLAEQTGMIGEIGEHVLRTACAQLKTWQDGDLAHISMAINVSVLQLLRAELPARLRAILNDNLINPAKLELELTESTLMTRADQSLSMLHDLKAIGVRLAIDDFGTGYSSLSHLTRLPIDTLKIDRGFVDDMMNDTDDKAIIVTIITMAHSLELNVVAEGVESTEQLQYLREQGCDEIQGYWLSPPLSAEDCTEFLRRNLRSAPLAVSG